MYYRTNVTLHDGISTGGFIRSIVQTLQKTETIPKTNMTAYRVYVEKQTRQQRFG